MSDEIYSRVVHQAPDYQVRLGINEFRGVEYLSLRKYYLDFEENWLPTKEGVSMPLDLDNSKELFAGLLEILSLAESKELIHQHFHQLVKDAYQDEELPRSCEQEVL